MIGVNVQPDEEEYVLPFLSGNGYRLTPARGSWEWAQENYGVRGAPSNFVIDREGRIIARPRVHSAATAAAAERLIRELIEQL
jgi:hypothetical protein